MVDKTLSQLITQTQQELYQASGLGVQVYAQNKIVANLQATFELIVSDPRYQWKRFYTFATHTLDGVSGRTITPITVANSFDDVVFVYPEDSDQPLTKWTAGRNPARMSGDYPMQYAYDPSGKIKVIPSTATGNIVVVGRYYANPYEWTLDSIVPFDSLALVYGAAWQYSVDDAANPGMVQKFQQLFETRLKQLHLNQSQEPISLSGGRDYAVPTYWSETP